MSAPRPPQIIPDSELATLTLISTSPPCEIIAQPDDGASPRRLTIDQLAALARCIRDPKFAAQGGIGTGNKLVLPNHKTGPGPEISALVRAGLMKCVGTIDDGASVQYYATPAGERTLRAWRAAAASGRVDDSLLGGAS
ncbi:MAG: hypothetical protein CMH91_01595 [Oceanicaulis sp.]|uniref:hypothetical protein n=1 Tax=unclassified Oceanicaulis TaxID=2632123 RepID=UPI000C51F84D|nr:MULTISPECIES: hypothetical protein [unclassified Oceanicaulis]MBC37742.1 hypothetical protein [Oceanicaulis sp.]MBG36911.1 hypothetical protein [Oceanicaulis sp.]HBU62672.1 hypothetical protein [Oceanicaulis sp.]|tara:strand:+ start:971 stop:1387 length:417 start_codon:yes stop_codon:yes gene_type:complete